MKLLLPLVVILTVFNFKANCRIYTDGPDGDLNPDFIDESQHLLTGSENPHTYDVDHQMKKDVNEENPIKLRGKADKNILKKLIKNLKSMEMDLQSIKENQENLKDVNTKLDSIIDANITGQLDTLKDVNSNQDTKLDSIIDANMDLQSIKEIQENITGKLDSLKDVNSNQNTKLDSLVDVNSNQNTKLDSLVDVNSNQNTKLDSLVDVNSNQNTKLDSLVDVNSNQNTKLDSIIDAIGTTSPTQGTTSPTQGTTSTTQGTTSPTQGCPNDMFLIGSGNGKQCFKFFNSSRMSWTAANTKCREENLVLAEPNEPLPLRAHLVMTYNPDYFTWLGGQGNGRSIRWLRSGNVISNTSPLWLGSGPGSRVTTADNLYLLTRKYHLDNYPSQPYYSHQGTNTYYALCELVLN